MCVDCGVTSRLERDVLEIVSHECEGVAGTGCGLPGKSASLSTATIAFLLGLVGAGRIPRQSGQASASASVACWRLNWHRYAPLFMLDSEIDVDFWAFAMDCVDMVEIEIPKRPTRHIYHLHRQCVVCEGSLAETMCFVSKRRV